MVESDFSEHVSHLQVDALAKVLLEEFGGPTENEGAVEMAIRLLRKQQGELHYIDQTLAFRPALESFETRSEKMEHMCSVNGRALALQGRVTRIAEDTILDKYGAPVLGTFATSIVAALVREHTDSIAKDAVHARRRKADPAHA